MVSTRIKKSLKWQISITSRDQTIASNFFNLGNLTLMGHLWAKMQHVLSHLYFTLLFIHKLKSFIGKQKMTFFEILSPYLPTFPFLKTLFPSTFLNEWFSTSNTYCFTFVTNSKYTTTYFD